MKRVWLALITFGLTVAAAPADVAPADLAPAWSSQNLMALERWVAMAPLDALPEPSSAALDKALAGGDQAAIDKAASELALKLARMYLLGAASAGERKGWNIEDSDKAIDVEGLLRGSLPLGTLDAFYASLLPRNPEYVALRTAYSSETDPAKRVAIARNMERWRWMPRSLGDEYVLVNAAAFEAQLWRDGREAGTWKVIVGKTRTPTPVFNAQITGVIFNPWWEVHARAAMSGAAGAIARGRERTTLSAR
ncbi:MAG: murein L,D-transpeptidase [Proteobacteria bacterium]|nr:murein L,D-transpeptidase [Pseudomonadota bacterium]